MANLPTKCIVCGKSLPGGLLWRVEKVWLRLTEVSYLWENCCRSKCYETLLEKLLSGEIKFSPGGIE